MPNDDSEGNVEVLRGGTHFFFLARALFATPWRYSARHTHTHAQIYIYKKDPKGVLSSALYRRRVVKAFGSGCLSEGLIHGRGKKNMMW